MQLFRGLATALATTAMLVASHPLAHAETLKSALVKAYHNNPQLNAQRAGVRATDEGVSKAQAGYRPQIAASGEIGAEAVNYRQPNPLSAPVRSRGPSSRIRRSCRAERGRNSSR